MVRDIFSTIGTLIGNTIWSLIIGLFIEITVSLLYVYFGHSNAIEFLNYCYVHDTSLLPDFLNSLISWVHQYVNSFDYLLVKALVLSIVIYLQKALIVLLSLYLYIFILVICIWDGIIFRELRRYRVGVESVRRKEFEGYAALIEFIMIAGYIFPWPIIIYAIFGIKFQIPVAIWFIGLGLVAALFHRIKFVYIQKYL